MKNIYAILLLFLIKTNIQAQTYIDPKSQEILVWDFPMEKFTYIFKEKTINLNISSQTDDQNFKVTFPNSKEIYTINIFEDSLYSIDSKGVKQVFYIASNAFETKISPQTLLKNAFTGIFYHESSERIMVIKMLDNNKFYIKVSSGNSWVDFEPMNVSKNYFGIIYKDSPFNESSYKLRKTTDQTKVRQSNGFEIVANSKSEIWIQKDLTPNLTDLPFNIKSKFSNDKDDN